MVEHAGYKHRPTRPDPNGSHATTSIGDKHPPTGGNPATGTELTDHNQRTLSTQDNSSCRHPIPVPRREAQRLLPQLTKEDDIEAYTEAFGQVALNEAWELEEWVCSHTLLLLLVVPKTKTQLLMHLAHAHPRGGHQGARNTPATARYESRHENIPYKPA